MAIDIGILVTVAMAVIAAWWAIAVIAIKQFEQRQDAKFVSLERNLTEQKDELDSHLQRQDFAMSEIRRVENELSRSQIEASSRYQTKVDAANQYGQILDAIRELGKRLDSFFGNGRTQ